MGGREGCISSCTPAGGGGKGPGARGPARTLLCHCVPRWALGFPSGLGWGAAASQACGSSPGVREASSPRQGLGTGACGTYPHPGLLPPLLTTMDARMGTWMIHFLFPELKSQHLGEAEASAPTPLLPP